MDIQKFIKEVLLDGARIANTSFGQVSSTTKEGDNNQVLTETDLRVGKLIVSRIQKTFSDHNIIDEEAGVLDKSSDYTWVVDPIDGTSNFANGLPTYGIMVGLLRGSQAVAGGIILPAFNNDLYLAERGKGATLNGVPIHVSTASELKSVLLAYGIDGHQENPRLTEIEAKLLGKIILNIRNLRSTNSAYDMVQVAAGRYGAFLNRTTKIWDNVALQPIIEEAGGLVTDFWGKPIDYSHPTKRSDENFTICAASPTLHEQIQAVIQE